METAALSDERKELRTIDGRDAKFDLMLGRLAASGTMTNSPSPSCYPPFHFASTKRIKPTRCGLVERFDRRASHHRMASIMTIAGPACRADKARSPVASLTEMTDSVDCPPFSPRQDALFSRSTAVVRLDGLPRSGMVSRIRS